MSDMQLIDPVAQERALYALAQAALDHWPGTYSDLTLIKYRENAVFSAMRDGVTKIALRVHRLDYHSDASLRSELQWVRCLAEAGLGVPDILLTTGGEELALVATPDLPQPRQVDMLGWLNGKPIGSIELGLDGTPEQQGALYHAVGILAARLHQRTKAWPLPAGFTRHAWDHEGLIGPQPFWGPFLELDGLTPFHRAKILRAVEESRLEMERYGRSTENFGLIHADFVPENIIVNDGRLHLIDFDDCGFGWYMFEIATALYFHIGTPNFHVLRDNMIAGYASVLPLSDADLRMIEVFLFLRSTTYLGWVHTRSETETAREMKDYFIERTMLLADALL